jgi:hypothetical protein
MVVGKRNRLLDGSATVLLTKSYPQSRVHTQVAVELWLLSAGSVDCESMFDELVATARGASGGAAVGAWARVENAASARRLSAIADLLEARLAQGGSADRDQWCVDNWDAVAAEVTADHGVSLGWRRIS